MAEREGFHSENYSVSGIEPWLDRHLFQRIVVHIPAWVSPNALSLANHVVVWTVLYLAGLSAYLGPWGSFTARVGAAIGIFLSATLDCLDGTHARRTGQASRLGEVMDHWLDSINVPLMPAAILLTMGVDPLTTAFALVAGTVPYNAQLVLYHHTGRFVHPHTSGIDGQIYLSIAFVAMGVLFSFVVPQTNSWAVLGLQVFAWSGVLVAVAQDLFYVRRLGALVLPHLQFVAVCAGWSTLYVLGIVGPVVHVIGIAMLSLRVSGSYVLFTVTGRRYGGMDWSIPAWLALVAATPLLPEGVTLFGRSIEPLIPWLFVTYLAGASLADFLKELGGLLAEARARRGLR